MKDKGQPDQILKDPGGKTELVYYLLFKDNAFRVKVYFSCFAGKTELFTMVDCINERNRIMPGGHKAGLKRASAVILARPDIDIAGGITGRAIGPDSAPANDRAKP